MSLTPASARSRVEANRQNARKSTGPRTVEGKQRSSLNALHPGQLPYGFDSPNEAISEPISAMPATSMASFGTEKKAG